MSRFYCNFPLAVGRTVALPPSVAHHLHVVRMVPGQILTLFNGEGGEYAALLVALDKKRASAEIKAFVPREVELPYAITLAQALPEGTKMDWIVEKAVELGVAALVPLASRRCVVRIAGERAEKKFAHWQGVIVAASEQSGRNRLLRLSELNQFASWIAQQDMHRRILFSPRATCTLSDWARHQPPQALTLMIGPEGGFSDEEEAAALAHGALALSMGPRILRTETAGLCAAATLNAVWGER